MRSDTELAEAVKRSEAQEKSLLAKAYSDELEVIEQKRCNELFELFNRHFFVAMVGTGARQTKIIELKNGGKRLSFMNQDDFFLRFCNIRVCLRSPATRKPTWYPVAERWLKWGWRRQYMEDGLVFAPGRPLEWEGGINRWRGLAVEPKQGDWSPLRDLIERVLCGDDKQVSEYFLSWLAHLVQKPGVQTTSCMVFRSDHEGAGKGLIGHTIGSLFGPNYHYIQKKRDVTGDFAALGDCLFAVLDEAMFAGDHEGSEMLKTLVSDQERRVEVKYLPTEIVPNHLNLMILGNNQWIARTGLKNRRFVYVNVPEVYSPSDPYWSQFWLEQEHPDHPGVKRRLPPLQWRQAMLHDLLHRDISKFNSRNIPHTAEEGRQKLLSHRGVPAFLYECLGEGAIVYEQTPAYSRTIPWEDDKPLVIQRRVLERAVHQHYKRQNERGPLPSIDNIGRELRKLLPGGITNARPRDDVVNPGYSRCYRLAALKECRRAFETALGTPIAWEE